MSASSAATSKLFKNNSFSEKMNHLENQQSETKTILNKKSSATVIKEVQEAIYNAVCDLETWKSEILLDVEIYGEKISVLKMYALKPVVRD